jgi:diaminohydroxyphosphoribosylaminopyrimidine deaminase/5-amino-6-(5-phosphoribosylamino)uracil reductase
MFDLPQLVSLDDKRSLSWREVRQVGDDLRIVARFAAG